ncbi:uncharacterized protein LOC114161502 isoform X1 [Xiphophorus couchianus]|uniref:uncharacterized protein LOC114161502 isoform X1 n=2 Tax=Xiphophorus couchianus TaxID=32473 RepID=UPI0010160AEC|nr:uncharacterized protein LOC114161502 isoform X1 [Xiphophorus couchianus]
MFSRGHQRSTTVGCNFTQVKFTGVNMNRHAFTPLPARPPAYPLMGYQDRNFGLQPPGRTQRPYFDRAFHQAAQKSSRSATRSSSSCLHVYIAWRIYYHKQLKKMHQKSQSLPQETVMKFPITNLLDLEQPKQPQPSRRRPYLDSAFRSTAGREKAINAGHNPSDQPEPHPSTPAFRPNEKADLERPKGCQTNPTSGSLDRKRHPEGCSSDGVKRLKQEDERPDPSLFTAPSTDPSTSRMQAQPTSISRLCASCCCTCVSYPGTELHLYQTASWEQAWSHRVDVHLRQKVFKEYFCERFPPTLAPHVYSPLDSVYLPDQNTPPSFLSLL